MNQIDPSLRTTTSLGEFRRLPSKRSASTLIVPSTSVRVTRRARCSQLTRRPSGSTVCPLVWPAGERKVTPSVAFVPAQDPVVRDVGPDQVAARRE